MKVTLSTPCSAARSPPRGRLTPPDGGDGPNYRQV
jgi:hypothetical protein